MPIAQKVAETQGFPATKSNLPNLFLALGPIGKPCRAEISEIFNTISRMEAMSSRVFVPELPARDH
jgi:hypothetical protein